MNRIRAFSPQSPLLLVTDYPASAGGRGSVILRSLLGQAEDRDAVVWASPSPASGSHRQDVTLSPGSALLAKMMGRRSIIADSLLGGRVAEEGAEVLRRLWGSPASHGGQHVTAEELRRRHCDLETNRRTLFGALDALVGS